MSKKLPISVIFLTLNEEYHIVEAIENVKPWVEGVFVVDSLSDDNTVDLVLKKGAKVVQRPFTNFGDQWNYALDNLPIVTEWTMKLDPDERVSDKLWVEIGEHINKSICEGFSFKRQLWFMNKPINVFDEVIRIWKTKQCKFTDVLVNEHPIVEGRVKKLRNFMNHHDSKNLHEWLNKQNRYSTLEAITKYKKLNLAFKPKIFGSQLERKMFLKKYFYSIPFNYNLYWFYLYFKNNLWKSGFEGKEWASCRVEIMKLRYRKFYEMKYNHVVYESNYIKTKRIYHPLIKNSLLQNKFYNLND